jgi:hypothetical protein
VIIIIVSIVGGIALLGVIGFVIFRHLKNKKKSQVLIEANDD